MPNLICFFFKYGLLFYNDNKKERHAFWFLSNEHFNFLLYKNCKWNKNKEKCLFKYKLK